MPTSRAVLTRGAFPGMAAVLRRLAENPQGAASLPWRDCVAEMIGK